MSLLFALPLAAALFIGWSWTSYCVAARLFGGEPGHVRAAAAAVVQLWLGIVLFHALGALHAFRLSAVIPLGVGLTAAAHVGFGRAAAACLRADLAILAEGVRALRRRRALAVLLGGLALIVGLRLTRGLVSPPLAWDSLTYHYVKPALWVQDGAYLLDRGPDAIGYYRFYPYGAEILWAWAMLPSHGDALLAPAAVFAWALVPLGAFSLARTLGVARAQALATAIAAGTIPAALNLSTSGYADVLVLAAFLLTAVFLLRLRTPASALLAMAGFGVLATTKLSGFPMLVGGIAVVIALGRRCGPAALALGAATALAAAAPMYGFTWHTTGSPVYPLALDLFGHSLHPGNPEFVALNAGLLSGQDVFEPLSDFLRALMVPWGASFPTEHLGFGLLFPVIVLFGIGGAVRVLKVRGSRFALVALLLLAALPAIALLSPDMIALRTVWKDASARLMLPLPALLLTLGAVTQTSFTSRLLLLIGATNLLQCIPQGFSAPAVSGMLSVAPWLALGLLCVLVLLRFRRDVAAIAAIAACALIGARLEPLRMDLRHRIYDAMQDPRAPAFEMHPVRHNIATAAPLWRMLDGGTPHRLAVTVGWDGVGHNLFRFPLFGAHLQNHLEYVPVTSDGSLVDYRTLAPAQTDERAWLRRIIDRQIEFVVALGPQPPEVAWMDASPEVFPPVVVGFHRIYRVDRDRARAAVAGTTGR